MNRAALLFCVLSVGCGAASAEGSTTPAAHGNDPIVGITTRAEIESAFPAWAEEAAAVEIDEIAVHDLAQADPGAEVDVFLGTWCGDSRRGVSRIFRALEALPEPRPFTVRLIGVGRDKHAPGLTDDVELRFVPTIIVRRDGEEVGRIVETTPRAIERELADLLTGRAHGVISARTDL